MATPTSTPAETNTNNLSTLAAAVTSSPLQKKAVETVVTFARRNPWKAAAILAASGIALVLWGQKNKAAT